MVVRRSEEKLLKSSDDSFVLIAEFNSRAIAKSSSGELFELDKISKCIRRNLTEYSKRNSWSGIDIGGAEHVVPLEPLLLVAVNI